MVIDKEKIEPEAQEHENLPNTIIIKRNFHSEIKAMKETSKELSLKRESQRQRRNPNNNVLKARKARI